MALGHGCANTAPSAQWQDLELIFRRLLHHGNKCERREEVAHASLRPAETFMRAYLRPTEAAFFRVRKCANNHQLIVASVERFLRHAYTACSVSYRHANCRVHYVYIRKHWLAFFFVHGNGNTHAPYTLHITRGWNLFYFDGFLRLACLPFKKFFCKQEFFQRVVQCIP